MNSMASEIALAQSDFSLNEEHRTLVVQNLTELRDSVWETMSLNSVRLISLISINTLSFVVHMRCRHWQVIGKLPRLHVRRSSMNLWRLSLNITPSNESSRRCAFSLA